MCCSLGHPCRCAPSARVGSLLSTMDRDCDRCGTPIGLAPGAPESVKLCPVCTVALQSLCPMCELDPVSMDRPLCVDCWEGSIDAEV